MAIGSFAIGDNQTPANPQVETRGAVNAPDSGAFTITATDGETVLTDNDYSYSGGVLTIKSATPMTIKNTNTGSTTDQIKVEGAATITLAGVNIEATTGAALAITDNATFNVNITLAENSNNTLIGEAGDIEAYPEVKGSPGIDKSDDGSVGIDQLGKLTIKGTGQLTAEGGVFVAGIGGGMQANGEKIEITGGVIKATGGQDGAGIGGGIMANGTGITISGGKVEAYTGDWKDDDNGNVLGAGIGGGSSLNDEGGQASGNKLSGNAVVFAASGGEYKDGTKKEALQGFDSASQGSITGGIAFTGVGIYEYVPDPDDPDEGTWVLKSTTWNEGEQYGDVTITEDITFPAGLKIDSTEALTIGKNAAGKEAVISMAEGKELTVEGTLTNEGIIDIPAENLVCGEDNGEITTLLNYDPQGGAIKTNDDNYITYQDSDSIKKYESLPEATKEGYDLEGWHTEKTGKKDTKVDSNTKVLLNQHMLYANWVESEPPTPTPPTPTPPGPEPTPTPEPSVNPDGDGSGSGASSKTGDSFAGVAALALLGVATTGAILTRKLR